MPEAEVNLSILNVGFGDVAYQGVAELEASYIDRGPVCERHGRLGEV